MSPDRIDALAWLGVARGLDEHGWAVLPKPLSEAECDAVSELYGDTPAFRSHVVMARHGFGQGEYRYFA